MKRIIIMLTLVLAFSGCVGTPAAVGDTERVVKVKAPRETEVVPVAESVDVVGTASEAVIEVKVEEELMIKDKPGNELRLVYESPQSVTQSRPPFASAELDLSASTPGEIVIKVLYFDEDGQRIDWNNPWGIDPTGGQVFISIWKGTPTEAERVEARKTDHEEDFQVLGLTGFRLTSSENTMSIPTSALHPYDGDNLTVMFYIEKMSWGMNPPAPWFQDITEKGMAAWSAIMEKNW